MKNLKNILVASILSLFALTSIAQTSIDTLQKLDEVDIIKAYEPILISSNKVPFAPSLPNLVKAKPDAQTYTYSDVKGKISYNPEEIKPIKNAGKKPEKNQFFYAKIGFGYPLAALAKIIVTNPIQTKYRAGLDIDFLLTKSNKPKKYQDFTNFKLKGNGEYFIKKSAAIGAELFYKLDQYKFYPYSDVVFTKDSLKTNYNRFGGKVYIKNINDADYYYNLIVNFASVINKNIYHNPKELTIDVNVEGGYNFKKNYWAGAKLKVINVSYNDNYKDTLFTALNKQNHFTIQATPYAKVKYKIWQLTAGPDFMITNRHFYVLPYILNQLQIYKDYVVMYNEWTNQVKINSLNNLSVENPWVNTLNYNNSVDQTRTIIGLRGAIKGFGYDMKFSHLVSDENAQFITKTYFPPYTETNQMGFDVQTIGRIQAWNPHIGLSYQKGNMFGAKVWFDYLIYNKNTAIELSYLPKVKFGMSAFYNWKEKLYINLDVTAQDKVNAVGYTYADPAGLTKSTQSIKGLVDVNLSANYFITKNIGIFVDVNNVGFQKWQRFSNYPTYNFQVIAGAKLSF